MNKVLFAQGQYSRSKEYAIKTQLIEKSGRLTIVKAPLFAEGEQHIRDIFETYNKFKNVETSFKLPLTILKDNTIEIEFIEGANLESRIEEFLFEGKLDDANKLVSKFIKFLDSLSTIEIDPYLSPEFIRDFDPTQKYNSGEKIACWERGFYDLNFDNIIENYGKYYLIDFEWYFPYPLPKHLMLLRSIFYLSIKLGSLIQRMVSEDFPCYNYYNDLYIPVAWLDLIPHKNLSVQVLLDYEYSLISQIYISPTRPEKVRNDSSSQIVTSPSVPTFKDIDFYNREIDTLNLSIASLSEIVSNQSKEMGELNSKIEAQSEILRDSQQERDSLILRYSGKRYLIADKIAGSRLAQIRPLRNIVKKMLKFVLR